MEIKEQLEFLTTLQHEMNTQDNVGQASPRFWVVMDYKKEPCWEGHAEEWVIYSCANCEEYSIEEEAIKEVIENYNLTGEALEILENFVDMGDNDVLDWFQKYVDEQAYLVPQKEVEYIVPNTLFLTLNEARKHIQMNSHRYTSKAHTYAMTAFRSPQVEKLWDILENLNLDIFKQHI